MSHPSRLIRVLPSADLPAGEGTATQIRRVRVGDSHVLVARLDDGRVVAFAPYCPHQATDLDDATVSSGTLRCPRHGYLYDLATGQNLHPARDTDPQDLWKVRPGHLPRFEVEERDGWLWVGDAALPPPEAYDPELERPRLPGAPGGPPPPPAPSSTAADAQTMKFLSATAGSTFEIRLPTSPRPGHAWSIDVVGDAVAVRDQQFEPGEYPCHRLVVEAVGTGAATLRCAYSMGGTETEVRTYIVRVAPA